MGLFTLAMAGAVWAASAPALSPFDERVAAFAPTMDARIARTRHPGNEDERHQLMDELLYAEAARMPEIAALARELMDGSPHPETARRAAALLGMLLRRPEWGETERADLLAALDGARRAHALPGVRLEAAVRLAAFGRDVLDTFDAALADPGLDLEAKAVIPHAMGRLATPAAFDRLRALANDSASPRLRIEALFALDHAEQIQPVEAIEAIERAAREGDPKTRALAVAMLCTRAPAEELGGPASDAALRLLAEETNDVASISMRMTMRDAGFDVELHAPKATYNRSLVDSYANTWWNSGNHACGTYSSCTPYSYWGWEICGYASQGGDCANFVSQCVLAGGHANLSGGLPCRGYPCGKEEIGAKNLGDCLVLRGWQRTCGHKQGPPSGIQVGDVLVLHDSSCSSYGAHATVVTYVNGSDVRVSCHSANKSDVAHNYMDGSKPYREWLKYPDPPQTGGIRVNLSPAAAVSAGAQWRVDGGAWQNSGATVEGLSAGNHTVSFKDVTGWNKPSDKAVSVTAGSTTTTDGVYEQQTGAVAVTIDPAEARALGAQWRLDGGSWRASGAIASGLAVGAHTVSFSALANWDAPADVPVTVVYRQTAAVARAYSPHMGELTATILPAEAAALAHWRAPDAGPWRVSGEVAAMTVGTHRVSFEPLAGWFEPAATTVSIVRAQRAAVTGSYVRMVGAVSCSIQADDTPHPDMAWRLNDSPWMTGGAWLTDWPVGTATMTFRSVEGWFEPAAVTCLIEHAVSLSVTSSYVRQRGALRVEAQPAAASADGARWRRTGGEWRGSGETESGLPTGTYTIEFDDTPDWLAPEDVEASVVYADTISVTAAYTRKSGVLCADALPVEVQADAVWRIDGGTARAPGDCAGAATGSREVTFDWVNGWQSPPPQTVALAWGATSSCTGVYTRTNHPPVLDLPARWTVRAGVTFGAVFHALDPESNACLVTTTEKPSGSIVADTGDGHAFYWPTPPGIAGATQWLAVVACDNGGLCSTARCALVIGTPPHWDGPTACTALMGRTTRVCVTLNEPDADTPAVELEAPAYVALTASGGVHCLDIAPPLLSAGTVAVARLSAVDPDGAAEHLLHVHVRGLPRLELTPFREVARGASVMELVNAWDPDGESLALAVGPLPDGASFTGGGASGLLRYVAAQGTTDALHAVVFTTGDSDGAVTGRIVFCVGEPADDGDADGLPDAWEWRNFDGPVQCEPGDDLDGDGHTARAEWVAGTDPNVSTSIFQVGLGAVSNGAVSELHWPSVSGRLYRILRSDTLGVEAWSPMTNLQATPPLNRWSLPTNLSKGYFLIEVEREAAP